MLFYDLIEMRDAVDRVIARCRVGTGKALRLICEACASGEVNWDPISVLGKPSDYQYGPTKPSQWQDAVIELHHGILRCGNDWFQLPRIDWKDFEEWLESSQKGRLPRSVLLSLRETIRLITQLTGEPEDHVCEALVAAATDGTISATGCLHASALPGEPEYFAARLNTRTDVPPEAWGDASCWNISRVGLYSVVRFDRVEIGRWLDSATQPEPLAVAGKPRLAPSNIRTNKVKEAAPIATATVTKPPKKIEAFRTGVDTTYPSGIPAGTGAPIPTNDADCGRSRAIGGVRKCEDAGSLHSNANLRKAVHDTVAELGTPGKHVPWKRFCDSVRKRCGVSTEVRGYGDKTIIRIVRAIVACKSE
jgi:hypothetical protein